MLTIGIDFGTTNCSAAIYRNNQPELIPLEDGRTILPSMLCITKEHKAFVGRAAVELYLKLTREMPIRYKFTDLRELTSVFAGEVEESPITSSEHGLVIVSNAGEDEDLDAPARLFQSLKTGLRDPDFHGTTIYGRYYAIEELIALILGAIRERAQAYLRAPVEATVIGRPISYAANERPSDVTPEEIDSTAHERMLAAARLAGFTHTGLEFEPVAAARLLHRNLPMGSRALVFDFGGGTLDLALAEVTDGNVPEIIATHGVPLGGDDFDSAIMGHSLLKHFGQGTTLGPKRLPFPPNLLAPLLHWQTIPRLATPASAAHIAAIRRQSNAPQAIENLQTLVRQGLGFRLFQLIESAKITLSDRPSTDIVFRERGLHIEEQITRPAFVQAITDHLVHIEKSLTETLARAHVSNREIHAVLMTGGSSLVPAVQNLVRRIVGPDKVHIADPFTSIVTGLAIVAAEDDLPQPVSDVVPSATEARVRAEAVTIGEKVLFRRGHQTVEGLVVRRAGGRFHDAILIIEFWDQEIEQFVSTMRHETKVTRLLGSR